MTDPLRPASPANRSLRVQRGCILGYRVFDVADEINLDVAERLFADAPGKRRVILRRDAAQVLEFTAPPVDIEIGKRTLGLTAGGAAEALLSVRFFDYGAVSVEFEIDIA